MNSISSVVTHNLSWFSAVPRIVRMCVFKFGILPLSTIYERFFLNRFNNHFQGIGWCGLSQNYDDGRAQKTIKVLKALGAQETFLFPKDEEARIQAMTLKAATVKAKIEMKGGTWTKEGDRLVIRGPKNSTPEWKDFYDNVLKKVFYYEETDGENHLLVTSENARDIPFFSWVSRKKIDCVLFSCFAKLFSMNRREITYFLGKGIDVAFYDGRGMLNSDGYPSEGGSYNDIEAVGEHLFTEMGYRPDKSCIFGSCGESLPGMHLFKKYHRQGIHLLLRSAPISLDSVIDRINPIASWIFGWNKAYFRAPKNSKCAQAPEDGYNSMGKIENLSNRRSGSALLLSTLGDTTSPPEKTQEMGKKIREHGGDVTVIEGKLEDSKNGKNNHDPHAADPLRNPKIQKDIHAFLFG